MLEWAGKGEGQSCSEREKRTRERKGDRKGREEKQRMLDAGVLETAQSHPKGFSSTQTAREKLETFFLQDTGTRIVDDSSLSFQDKNTMYQTEYMHEKKQQT